MVNKRIIFSIVTLFLIFLLAEFALFLLGFESKSQAFISFEGNPERRLAEQGENYDGSKDVIFVTDDVTFWKFKPSSKISMSPNFRMLTEFYSLYTINSQGFRGKDFRKEKEKDTYRIIALGDSITFGLCVPEEKTYYKVLENLLNERLSPLKVEVISLGVPGYSSYQGLQMLQHEALLYSPDMATLYFGGNNEFAKSKYTDREYAQAIRGSLLDRWSKKIRTLGLLKSISLKLKNWTADEERNGRKTTFRVPPLNFLGDLAQMKRFLDKSGIESISVVPPHSSKNLERQPYGEQYGEIARFLGNYVCVADVDSQFKQRGADALFTEDDVHPNEAGHRVIAEALYEVAGEKIEEFFAEKIWGPLPSCYSRGKVNQFIRKAFEPRADQLLAGALLALYTNKQADTEYDVTNYGIEVVDGYSGKSANFNGRNSYVRTSLRLNDMTGFSIMFWIKPSRKQTGSIVTIFDNGHTAKEDCVLQSMDIADDTYTFHCFGLDSVVELPPNIWTHVLITVDLQGRSSCVCVNGQEQSRSKLREAHRFGRAPLTFGKLAEANDRHFRGTIDEIFVWGRAFGEEDVRALTCISRLGTDENL